jgi:hypothetical protein
MNVKHQAVRLLKQNFYMKKQILLLTLILGFSRLQAQNESEIKKNEITISNKKFSINDYHTMAEKPDANFFEIVKSTRAQLKEIKKNLPLELEGKENHTFRELNAQFERWVWNTKGLVGKDGKISPSNQGWENYLKVNPDFIKKSAKKDRSSTIWTNFTPFTNYTPNDSTHANGWTYGYGVGRINVVRQNPTNKSKLYAGGAVGGVFVSNDYGENWMPLTDQFSGLGVSDLVINPTDPNKILLATGDYDGRHINSIGIFKSLDGGVTWTNTLPLTLPQGKLIAHIKHDPSNSNTVYATHSDNIYKSTDAGDTWNPVHTVSNAGFNDIVITSNGTLFVSARNGNLYRSTNNGTTWSTIATGKTDRVDIDYSTNFNTIYLLGQSNPAFRKYNVTTSSFVAAWSNITTSGPAVAYNSQSGYNQVICVKPGVNEIIEIGEFNGKRSVNGGTTWTNSLNGYYDGPADWGGFYVHSDHHFMEYIGNTDTLLNGNDGGVYIGNTNTNSWQSKFKGLAVTQSYSMAIHETSPEAFIFGNQDNDGHSRANSSGYKWFNAQAGDGTATAINPTNQNQRLLGGTQGSLSRVSDGYASSPFGTGITPSGASASFVYPLETHPAGNFFYGGYDQIQKYNFSANNWTVLGDPNGSGNYIDYIELANLTATTSKMYIISDGGDAYKIYRSSNDGATFTFVPDPSASQYTQAVSCSKTNYDSVYAIAQGYSATDKVFSSIDGGANWTNITYNMPNIRMTAIKLKQGSDTLFVGTELGLYFIKLSNPSPTWAKYGNGLPNVKINEIEINYTHKKLYVATYGRGGWLIDLANFALPINNLTFNANKVSNSDNQYNLAWTWNEESLAQVELQKSENGLDFTTLETVKSQPNLATSKLVTVLKQKEYYRLKGTYNNGKSEVSNVIVLSSTSNTNQVYIYPNPTNGVLHVSSSSDIRNVRILDIKGAQVATANPNSTNYFVNLDFLPSGMYFIEVINNKDEITREKIMLNK